MDASTEPRPYMHSFTSHWSEQNVRRHGGPENKSLRTPVEKVEHKRSCDVRADTLRFVHGKTRARAHHPDASFSSLGDQFANCLWSDVVSIQGMPPPKNGRCAIQSRRSRVSHCTRGCVCVCACASIVRTELAALHLSRDFVDNTVRLTPKINYV